MNDLEPVQLVSPVSRKRVVVRGTVHLGVPDSASEQGRGLTCCHGRSDTSRIIATEAEINCASCQQTIKAHNEGRRCKADGCWRTAMSDHTDFCNYHL